MRYFKNVKYKVLVMLDDGGKRAVYLANDYI